MLPRPPLAPRVLALAAAVLVLAGIAAHAAPPAPSTPGPTVMVARVLLKKGAEPPADAVLAAYSGIAPKGPALAAQPSADPKSSQVFDVGGSVVSVDLLAAPVADKLADKAAAASLHGFLKDWRPATHKAQLVVSLRADPKRPLALAHADFLRVTAAVATAADAVGVFLEGGAVTHPTAFFSEAAMQEPPLVAGYTGITRVFERDPDATDPKAPPTRFGLLSHGMAALGYPDLYLTAPLAQAGDGLEYFLDLLAYMVERGQPLPDGDTVGRTDSEKLKVHYEASPAGGDARVWRVDLP